MSPPPKKLYLIDGANYLFRAFYAIRNLSNSVGLPTGALYGFAQMLLKLLREEKPDLVAVCFDTPEPTFRDEMYKDYKANRKAPPDDLVQQFPYARPLAAVLGLPVIEKPGFEADDIIGTLARKYSSKGYEVIIVSGDKDLMQLVGPAVSMLDEMKDLRIGPDDVRARFGVGPEGVAHVLALAGDTSDNIPGVPGIGPKTASSLIAKYGSLEGVIAHADEFPKTLAAKIKAHAEDARLSFKLASIDTGVEIDDSETLLTRRSVDEEKMRELLGELEFSKIMAELAPRDVLVDEQYRVADDDDALGRVTQEIRSTGRFALSIVAGGENPMLAEIAGVGLAWAPAKAVYVPLVPFVRTHLTSILADPKTQKVGHNLNFAFTVFKRMGFSADGPAFDTMIASYLINPVLKHDVATLVERHLGQRMIRDEDVLGKGKAQRTVTSVAPDELMNIACSKAQASLRLSSILKDELERQNLSTLFNDLEMPLVRVLVDMQIAGVKVDGERLKMVSDDFQVRLAQLEGRIYVLAGERFNINSPRQLGRILFERMKLPAAKRTKTGFSTSQAILEELGDSHELPRLVLNYRSLSKLKSTYADALPNLIVPETGRIHTSFNQAVTATGRLSSSEPNLQNIPVRGEEGRKIRGAFIAEDGFVLLSCDYSQIELRVLAHMSGDTRLVEAFERNEDVHAVTAAGIFRTSLENVTAEQRAVGKTVNFATIYGQGAFGLARHLGIAVADAADYIAGYFRRYPGVAAYREEVLKKARMEGMVTTLFGRRRPVPDITSTNASLKQEAERAAFNTVFQGTAADIIKRAMITIHAGISRISLNARMIIQVHDELVFEVPETDVESVREFVIREMEGAADLNVPLVVSAGVGKNWAEVD